MKKIRSLAQNDSFFKFQKVSLEQMHTEIGRLNPKKATTFKNIPAKVLKSSSEICSESMQLLFNDCVQNGLFPDLLKLADVTSLHKMEEKTRRKIYRPVSVLPTVFKVLRDFWTNRLLIIWDPIYRHFFAVFVQGIMRSMRWFEYLKNGKQA